MCSYKYVKFYKAFFSRTFYFNMLYEKLLSLSWSYLIMEFPNSAKGVIILGGYYHVIHMENSVQITRLSVFVSISYK